MSRSDLTHLSTKLPPALADELRRRADAGDRTVSGEIRRALRAYLSPVGNHVHNDDGAPHQDAVETFKEGTTNAQNARAA